MEEIKDQRIRPKVKKKEEKEKFECDQQNKDETKLLIDWKEMD